MSYAGKNVVVVGGSGAIGSNIVRTFLKLKVNKIAIIDINPPAGAALSLRAKHENLFFEKTDVADKDAVQSTLNRIHRAFGGRIDVLVNSQGVIDEQNVDKTIGINLVSVIYCTEAAIKLMSIENGGHGGTIMNISSYGGFSLLFQHPIYNSAKSAIIHYTRCVAHPYYAAAFGIKFVVICPGPTQTPLLSGGLQQRLYRPFPELDEYAATVSFQPADICAELSVSLLEKAESGSVWLVMDSKAQQVTFPSFEYPVLKSKL